MSKKQCIKLAAKIMQAKSEVDMADRELTKTRYRLKEDLFVCSGEDENRPLGLGYVYNPYFNHKNGWEREAPLTGDAKEAFVEATLKPLREKLAAAQKELDKLIEEV